MKENHDKRTDVWLLFYKKHTGKASVTYDEAVEEALCYGWIDSIVRRVDDNSYAQKFTPRKPASTWSASNLTRMNRLIEHGLVSTAGMNAYLGRSKGHSDTGQTEGRSSRLPEDLEAALKSSSPAWKNFQGQSPSHGKEYVPRVVGAKRREDKEKTDCRGHPPYPEKRGGPPS